MVKPILHFQIPMMPNATRENQIAIDLRVLSTFMNIINEKIGNEYDIVASPMKLQTCDNVEVKNIEFTMEDIERILKNKEKNIEVL